jgi:hypothetical protein
VDDRAEMDTNARKVDAGAGVATDAREVDAGVRVAAGVEERRGRWGGDHLLLLARFHILEGLLRSKSRVPFSKEKCF